MFIRLKEVVESQRQKEREREHSRSIIERQLKPIFSENIRLQKAICEEVFDYGCHGSHNALKIN